MLLPGAAGFERRDSFIVNPSYYAFALFNDLAPLAPSPLWTALRQDGTALVLQGRYGRWQLPPDWVKVDRADGSLGIAPGWPPRFFSIRSAVLEASENAPALAWAATIDCSRKVLKSELSGAIACASRRPA